MVAETTHDDSVDEYIDVEPHGSTPEVGDVLRRLRHRANLSGAALGKRIDISHTRINDIERGKSDAITLTTIVRVAEALGLNVELRIYGKLRLATQGEISKKDHTRALR